MSEINVDKYISNTLAKYPKLQKAEPSIKEAFELLYNSFSTSNKLLVCGNGGSAADAEHVVAELVNSFAFKRKLSITIHDQLTRAGLDKELTDNLQPALRAISLGSHSGLITAIANDIGYPLVYAQQVLGYGDEGDVLLAISTSGNSENVINAVKVANGLGLRTIGLTDNKSSELDAIAQLGIRVDSAITSEIQELHLPVYHLLCGMLEEAFFEKKM